MEDQQPTGPETPEVTPEAPQEATPEVAEGSFDQMVGEGQPGEPEGPSDDSSKDGQPPKESEPEGEEPEDNSAAEPGEEGEDEEPTGGADKFKTLATAKQGYIELQKKMGEQAKELGQLREYKVGAEKQETFLNNLDQVLGSNPELAESLRKAFAELSDGEDVETPDANKSGDDLKSQIESVLEERDKAQKSKEEAAESKKQIDSWWKDKGNELKEIVDDKGNKLGHLILDRIEKQKLPFNAETLQLVYDALTKDRKASEKAEEAVKKEKIAELERENASAVGGGSGGRGETPEKGGFDSLIGEGGNPNHI